MALIAFSFTGCSRRILDFTIVSSKTADFTKGGFTKGKQRVEGIDMVHIIIIIPTGSLDIKDAVDRAIEKTPGCIALLDGVIRTKAFYIPYIYGQSSAIVEGTPLIDPSIAMKNETSPSYSVIKLKKDGNVKEVESISKEEYLALKANIIKNSKTISE